MRRAVLGIIRRSLEAGIRIALIKIALRKQILKGELYMKVRVTTHNAKSGKHGAFNPKHNDRQFDVTKSDHIDAMRMLENVNWDYQRGYRFPGKSEDDGITFEDVELAYYKENFGEYVQNQNARNEKQRHPERNREVEDMYRDVKTCPEETIWQIGNREQEADPDLLLEIVEEFLDWRDKEYGSNVVTLDYSLHNDESTPHIHERHVFQCKNRYGELIPQQENALKELGIELPEPKKPSGKFNNRKITFDATCRRKLLEICKTHGLDVEEVPIYGGKKSMEKNDYIIEKQQQTMMNQKIELNDVQEELNDKNAVLENTNKAVNRKKRELKDAKDELEDTATKLTDYKKKLEQKEQLLQTKKTQIAQYDEQIEEKEHRLEVVEENTSEADAFVADVCEMAFDIVYDRVADEVARQTRFKYWQDVYDTEMELLDAGFPQEIRRTIGDAFSRLIDKFEESIRTIVDNIKYSLHRDFTESHAREELEDKVWEHVENKAEYDRAKGETESLMNQLAQGRPRRRGR